MLAHVYVRERVRAFCGKNKYADKDVVYFKEIWTKLKNKTISVRQIIQICPWKETKLIKDLWITKSQGVTINSYIIEADAEVVFRKKQQKIF